MKWDADRHFRASRRHHIREAQLSNQLRYTKRQFRRRYFGMSVARFYVGIVLLALLGIALLSRLIASIFPFIRSQILLGAISLGVIVLVLFIVQRRKAEQDDYYANSPISADEVGRMRSQRGTKYKTRPEPRYCQSCSEGVLPEARFCANCGTSLS